MDELNRMFESGLEMPAELWEQWLWETDPQEPAELLNKCHLLGLLLARYRGRYRAHLAELVPGFETIVHAQTPVNEFGLRQVRDQLDDLQLHWNTYVQHLDKCHELLDALMTRFGMLCDAGPHDDSESIDPNGMISVAALRHFLAIFLILYRHVWLWNNCHEHKHEHQVSINKYHVEASLDTFDTHSMVVQLPPAARLLYMQDFKGMYHNLSQVVYFHYPDYNAALQRPLDELQQGLSYHSLAPLGQVCPDIPVLMEDEMPSHTSWILISGGHVFLWHNKANIVYNHCIFDSVQIA